MKGKYLTNCLQIAICFVTCTIMFGCSAQRVPEGFPSKLVSFDVKLLHEGKPIRGAAIALATGSSYNVVGITGSDGVAKPATSINTYTKSGIPPATYKAIITYTPKAPSELSNEQLSKMTMEEVNANRAKVDAEIAAMPKIVPDDWGNLETTPVKITVPDSGGNVTIEITDPKTHQQ
jgi:hypothetical protein